MQPGVRGKVKKAPSPLYLYILNDQNLPEGTPKRFLYIKDLNDFKHRVTRQNDGKNRNTTRNLKCRFCDFFGSVASVHAHEVQAHRELVNESDQYELENVETRLRFTNSDARCQHLSSCVQTSSQPLMTRTDTSRSCCPV